MSNDVRVTVTGNAGSDPVVRRSDRGVEWSTFPVASTRRIRDTDGEFHDGPTLWFQVKAWGHAAVNIGKSVRKGQPVVVAGRLEVDEWGESTRRRTSLVINADSVGPNLMKGRAEFQRVFPSDGEPQGAPLERAPGPDTGRLAHDVPGPWASPGRDPWATPGGDAHAGPDGSGAAESGHARAADEPPGTPDEGSGRAADVTA
ncbi:hypothetical protein GCM10028784_04670 [Myceligenerans cantabricum]